MDEKKKWKRKLPYRIYDYNYKVGESYYNPQTDYIENRELLRSKVQPPEAASYAERFASKPFYGKTRGLPYEYEESALSQPLVDRRAKSGSRASRERELDDVPQSSSRPGRSHDRKLSFNLDDEQPEPRRRFSLIDDLDFKVPVKKYIDSDFGFKSSVGREPASDEDFGINPSAKKGIMDDIKKLEKQFKKADLIERGTGPHGKKWEEVVYNEAMDAPGKKTVKKDEVSYTVPGTGTTVRKSSYQESTKFESSKPPRAPPRPSRLLSLEDDPDFKMPPRPRRRNVSLSDDDFKVSSRFLKSVADEDDKKFRSATKMFKQRKAQESEELTDNINKMINKMRKHSIGDGDSYKYTRTVRSSSLDPYESEPRVKARTQARSHQFTYGFSK